RGPAACPRRAAGEPTPGPETGTDKHSATSGRPPGHDTAPRTDAIELWRLMEFVRVPFGEVLFGVIDAARLDQHQHAAAETAPHHSRPDHLGHPCGELHEAVKLPAAYREIEPQA